MAVEQAFDPWDVEPRIKRTLEDHRLASGRKEFHCVPKNGHRGGTESPRLLSVPPSQVVKERLLDVVLVNDREHQLGTEFTGERGLP